MLPSSKKEILDATQIDATKEEIFQGTEWWTADDINSFQRNTTSAKEVVEEWKQIGCVYSVSYKGNEYFARYQFDSMYKPRSVIKAVLDAYGACTDTWSIAAWFHFRNGWISNDDTISPSPVAPKDALDQRETIINAARNRRGTYVA